VVALFATFLIALSAGLSAHPLFIAGAAAAAGLVVIFISPYLGAILYMLVQYLRPEDYVPALGPLHLHRLIAITVLFVWLLRRQFSGESRRPLVKSKLGGAMVAMLLVMGLSAVTANWRGQAVGTTLDFAKKAVAFFFTVNLLDSRAGLRIYVWCFLLANGLLAAHQIASHSAQQALVEGLFRTGSETKGFMGDTNDFALGLCIALGVSLGIWRGEHSKLGRAASLALSLLFCASIVVTGSRGGATGMAVVLVGTALTSRRRALSLLLVAVLAFAIWGVSSPSYRERILGIGASIHADPAVVNRRQAWRAGAHIVAERPILGIGAGNFATSVPRYLTTPLWMEAHSAYIQVAAELGIVGLLVWLRLVWLTGAASRRVTRASTAGARLDAWPLSLGLGLGVALASYLVCGIFLSVAYYPHLCLLATLVTSQEHILATDPRQDNAASLDAAAGSSTLARASSEGVL
jgi:O-antigen ligase